MNSNMLGGNLSNMLNMYNSPGLSNLNAEAQKKSDNLVAATKDACPLVPFFDERYTDKNTLHSYLPVYAHLLRNAWGKPFRMLETGIQRGGSILGWCKAFPQATVYGVDCQKTVEIKAPNYKEIITNAYTEEFIQRMSYEELFDFVIDDGSHAHNDILFVCQYYHKLLKPGGVLVIEDVPDINWIPKYRAAATATGCTTEVIDLRHVKNRWDDLLLLIKKPRI